MATQPKSESDWNWGAWVWVKWKPGAPADAWESWKDHSHIKGAWSTSGEWDCWLWVDLDTPDEIEQFVWKDVRGNKWVENTGTHWAKKWW